MRNLYEWKECIKINYGSYAIIAYQMNNDYIIVAKTPNGGKYELATVYSGEIKILKSKSSRVKMFLYSRKVDDFIKKIKKISDTNQIINK